MSQAHLDRNLLFGILALQMDFVGRDALIAAMNSWVLDKAKPLSEVLSDQGALSGPRLELLEALVREHLAQHGDDAALSLAALNSVGSAWQEVGAIADADVQVSVAHVAFSLATRQTLNTSKPEEDPHGTRLPPAGTATSAGVRFRILRPHAKGGLGEVFVASDEELNREVALKEIQACHADHPESRARFVMEAEITGGLEHPGIVPVYGLGAYGDGRPFYAMRFIRGDSLHDAVARFHKADGPYRNPGQRSLALRGLLRRFIDVCNAIGYAHSRGVLHRDLKPGNIMLGPYGETLVVDWGLAKPIDRAESSQETGEATLRPSGSGDSIQTRMGQALGTPAYMPPEQAAGRLDELGPASDVYSLGATLYHLLTGKAPFQGTDVGAILRQVQEGEFLPLRRVNGSVPRALEAICLKAMARRPSDRYRSPREVADEVEHWLADEPVAALREPLRARLGRWARRHRQVVVGAGVLFVTATAALAIGLVMVGREQQQTEHRRLEAVVAREEADRNAEAEKKMRQLAEMQRNIAVANAEEAERQGRIARRQSANAKRNWETGIEAIEEKVQTQRQFAGGSHPDFANGLMTLASLHFSSGNLLRAKTLYTEAAQVIRKSLGADHPNRAACLMDLAKVCTLMGEYEKAETIYKDAIAVFEGRLGNDDPTFLAGLDAQASLYEAMGNHRLAERVCRQAFDRLKLNVAPFDPAYLSALNHLARLCIKLGQYTEAEQLSGQMMKICGRGVGKGNHWFVSAKLRHAVALVYLGHYKRAVAAATEEQDKLERGEEIPYELACVYSAASRAARTDTELSSEQQMKLAGDYAQTAVRYLSEAAAIDYFLTPVNVAELRRNKDLESLRSREDFQALLRGVEEKAMAKAK